MSTTVRVDVVGTDRASGTFNKAAAAANTAAASIDKAGAAMVRTGKKMTHVITLPVLLAAAASTKFATDFGAAMERIHTQAGGTEADVRSLSKQVLAMKGAQQGPVELANALYHLKSVGMGNAQAMHTLAQASNLAAVGHANLEETTNALAGAWRTGIKGATDMHSAVATLNAIIGAGNMTMEDLNAALGTGFLPTAKTFGLSLKDVGAALALFTDEGVPADAAATRLRMTISLLGAPTGAATKQLKKIGLTGLSLAQDMRKPNGLITAVGDLKSHLDHSGLSATKQAQLLSRAFGGGRSSSAILSMVNNFDVLRKKQDQVTAGMGKFDSAVEAQRKTAQAKFATLVASLQTTAVRIGNAVIPWITKLGGKIGDLADKFNSLDPAKQKLIIIGALILAALGPVVTIVGRLTLAFGALVKMTTAVWGFGAKVIGSFTAVDTYAAESAVRIAGYSAEFALAEADKAAAAAEAAVEIAASMEGTNSVLAATTSAAAADAIDFAASMQARADAAVAAAAEIEAASTETATATSSAFGPVGLAIGAVVGVGALAAHSLGLFGGSAKRQIKPTDDFTQAIQRDNNALGANTRKLVENKLEKDGAYDAGLKLGISQRTLTDALMGNKTALAQVNGALNMQDGIMASSYGLTNKQADANRKLSDAAGVLHGAIGDTTATLKVNQRAALNLTAADSKLAGTHDKAASAAAAHGAAVKKLSGVEVISRANAINLGSALKVLGNTHVTPSVKLAGTYAATLALNGIVSTMRRIGQGTTAVINIRTVNSATGGSHTVKAMATGGKVRGIGTDTSDSNLRALSNNEFVVNAKGTRQFEPLLEAINSGNAAGVRAFMDSFGGASTSTLDRLTAHANLAANGDRKIAENITIVEAGDPSKTVREISRHQQARGAV